MGKNKKSVKAALNYLYLLEMDELIEELPRAIEVILYTQSFDTGTYRTKYHDRDWKKIK